MRYVLTLVFILITKISSTSNDSIKVDTKYHRGVDRASIVLKTASNLKIEEGFSSVKYLDCNGNETIGWGFRLKYLKWPSDTMSRAQADSILINKLDTLYGIINAKYEFDDSTKLAIGMELAYWLGVQGSSVYVTRDSIASHKLLKDKAKFKSRCKRIIKRCKHD